MGVAIQENYLDDMQDSVTPCTEANVRQVKEDVCSDFSLKTTAEKNFWLVCATPVKGKKVKVTHYVPFIGALEV